ncbi:Abi-like protein [Sphingobium indicum UT26S]|uniref:Abi-like protein n=1 Tax=Sphingobium indicum (strain DSM 16413 / CCM 7287 / MTCC 6362 / UT26 / NBRC 101211 / UT26S) TaxID=452662 RepID=D4YZN3_SPHIU|nr:Abi-like protein [Sphingobium indicum UT26S]
MRPFNKPSKSIPDQIALLQERGLVINDVPLAQHSLGHISYYRLRAYWLYFEAAPDSGDHTFKPETTFEAVLALYEFDRRLRLALMDALERIEVAARGAWAHQMAMVYGPHGYLNAALYRRTDLFQANLDQLQSEYDRSHDVFVNHYKRTYNNPPLPPVWMAAEFISFGLLSKFFSALGGRADRKSIARNVGFDDRVFQGLMHHLATVRNVCAHHGRLWNRSFTVTFPIAQNPAALAQTLAPEADRKLYNTLTTLLHSMAIVAPNSNWPKQIATLVTENPVGDFAAMGFPEGWRERPLWAPLLSA